MYNDVWGCAEILPKAHFASTRSSVVDALFLGRGSRVFLPNVFLGQTRRESRTENIGTSFGLHFILKNVLCL